jgi:3-oxoacid CoA-transferase subunit A
MSARNFNPLAAMAGRVTVAEVEVLVEPGELGPEEVHTPGVFVQRVVALTAEQAADKRIEKRTVRPAVVEQAEEAEEVEGRGRLETAAAGEEVG